MDEIIRKLTWVREVVRSRLNHTDIDGVIASLISDIEQLKNNSEPITDAMAEISVVLEQGWWMQLRSPFRKGDQWFCGITPTMTTGWNGRPDIEAGGNDAPEAIKNCCAEWSRLPEGHAFFSARRNK